MTSAYLLDVRWSLRENRPDSGIGWQYKSSQQFCTKSSSQREYMEQDVRLVPFDFSSLRQNCIGLKQISLGAP